MYYYQFQLPQSLVRSVILFNFLLGNFFFASVVNAQQPLKFYKPDNPNIQYVGRIDFSNKRLPRFWQPGVYFSVKFKGDKCEVILNDEELYGKNHNYIEIVVDGKAYRTQTKSKTDTIKIKGIAGSGLHTLMVCKNTEANIGYLELVGIRCKKLVKPDPLPKRKIEFIGNSITCGASADLSEIPCGKGLWQDQHNAYLAYGPVAARALQAQYYLSSVSGIGLVHSCCNLNITMPEVFDKVSMRDNKIRWDFKIYQPDIVSICLGQNDGIQDSSKFCNAYIDFVKRLRDYYPGSKFILLSSPMADDSLRSFLRSTLSSICGELHRQGEHQVYHYVFEKQYKSGCDSHPDVNDHEQIAKEVATQIQSVMNW